MTEIRKEYVTLQAACKLGFTLIKEDDNYSAYHKLGRRGVVLKMVYSIQAGRGYVQLTAKIDDELIWSFGSYDWDEVLVALSCWKC